MVIRFTCEYKGTNYHGFQLQPNQRTIQSELETVMEKVLRQKITISASGRTDADVHAKGQVCSFLYNKKIDPYKFAQGMNSMLPSDIAIKDVVIEKEDFHARFSCARKTYIYKCYVSPYRSPLRDDRYLQLYTMPDVEAMQSAGKFLEGELDFTSFCSVHTEKEDKVRTIYSFQIQQVDDEIYFRICGNGFLKNMVRIIVGTLLDVGYGKIIPIEFRSILDAKDRKLAGKTALAKGLTLYSVEY